MTTEDEVNEWVASWEGQTLDFKDSRILNEPFKIAKLMAAFANTVGGELVIGIRDDHSYEGLKVNQQVITHLVNIARNNIDPPLDINPEIVHAREGDVYIVRVLKFSLNPHAVKQSGGKTYFIRVGDSVREPSTDELRKLFSHHGSSVNGRPADVEIAEQLRLQNARELRRRQQERYQRLAEDVFSPMRVYQGTPVPDVIDHNPWNQLKLVYDLSTVKSNPYFEEANRHLQKDEPGLMPNAEDLESKAREQSRDVEEFRSRVVLFRVRQSMDLVVEEAQGIKIVENYTNRPNEIYLAGVLSFLSSMWINPVVNLQTAGHPLDASLINRVIEIQDQITSNIDEGRVTIEGTHIATLPTEALGNDFVAAIKQLRRDVLILQGIVDLAKRKQELVNRIDAEVRRPLERITIMIGAERYETTCEYCPT